MPYTREVNIHDDHRPWGSERCITANEVSTVKLLFVQAGESCSLQYHHHRDEFWHVLIGSPSIICGEETIQASVGQEFSIPRETKHRITAGDVDVVILEVSTGNFDEADIVRIEDKYHRL